MKDPVQVFRAITKLKCCDEVFYSYMVVELW